MASLIPDHAAKLGRELLGTASLERAVRGRVVLVTGASSGIGRAAALKLAGAGAAVALVARDEGRLDEVRVAIEANGGTAQAFACDLTDASARERMTARLLERFGRLDVLVNNAGRSLRRTVEDSRDGDAERLMALNYHAPVALIRAFLPGMLDRRCGQIVNISTIGVQSHPPRFSAYVASKAALDGYSRCLGNEVERDGIAVTTIHMPLVRTPMIEPTPKFRQFPSLAPEQAARLIADAVVHRPNNISTLLGAAASFATPTTAGPAMAAGDRLLPRHSALRHVAFRQLLRAVHW